MKRIVYTLAICFVAITMASCSNENEEKTQTTKEEVIELPDETIPTEPRTEPLADFSFTLLIEDVSLPWELPIASGFDGTVTWGDDTQEEITEHLTHLYESNGLYNVTISSLSGSHTIHLNDINTIQELTIYQD